MGLELFEDAVAGADGNDGAGIDAAVEGESDGLECLLDPFVFGYAWRAEEDESADEDLMLSKELAGVFEVLDRHLFVESSECGWVGSFESERDFELCAEGLLEVRTVGAAEAGVVFDDHGFEVSDAVGDGFPVGAGNSELIKEVARVVEFHVWCWRELAEGVIDLCGDGVGRCWGGGCVLPEVAHEAVEAAFAAGEENGGDGFESPIPGELHFVQEMVGPEWIQGRAGTAGGEDGAGVRVHAGTPITDGRWIVSGGECCCGGSSGIPEPLGFEEESEGGDGAEDSGCGCGGAGIFFGDSAGLFEVHQANDAEVVGCCDHGVGSEDDGEYATALIALAPGGDEEI
ncbi:MAG: hypothetical protein RL215_3336 [Planctomycetota bacterium]